MAKRQSKVVQRSLYCFQLDLVPKDDVGQYGWRDLFESFTDITDENIQPTGDGAAFLLYVEHIDENEVRGHFSRLRYEWPRVLNLRKKEESHIPLDDATRVIERAHFIYYSRTNVLVAEYNHYGARAFGRFGPYIEHCRDEVKSCSLLPLMRKNVFEDARKRRGTFKKCEMKISPPALPVLEETFGLGISEVLGSDAESRKVNVDITIALSTGHSQQPLPRQIQRWMSKLIDALSREENREGFKKAELSADETINLMGEEFYRKVNVRASQNNPRVVVSSNMYEQLGRFYYEGVLRDFPDLKREA